MVGVAVVYYKLNCKTFSIPQQHETKVLTGDMVPRIYTCCATGLHFLFQGPTPAFHGSSPDFRGTTQDFQATTPSFLEPTPRRQVGLSASHGRGVYQSRARKEYNGCGRSGFLPRNYTNFHSTTPGRIGKTMAYTRNLPRNYTVLGDCLAPLLKNVQI